MCQTTTDKANHVVCYGRMTHIACASFLVGIVAALVIRNIDVYSLEPIRPLSEAQMCIMQYKFCSSELSAAVRGSYHQRQETSANGPSPSTGSWSEEWIGNGSCSNIKFNLSAMATDAWLIAATYPSQIQNWTTKRELFDQLGSHEYGCRSPRGVVSYNSPCPWLNGKAVPFVSLITFGGLASVTMDCTTP